MVGAIRPAFRANPAQRRLRARLLRPEAARQTCRLIEQRQKLPLYAGAIRLRQSVQRRPEPLERADQ